ncbi:MAG: hypothetical protein ABSB22_13410 [Thermodesulfobacteriota bacterium]
MTQYPGKDLLFQYKLIKYIVRQYPKMPEIMERYFGQNCLKKPGFKIQTLEMACILFDVDQKRLLQEFGKIQD